MDLTGVLVSGCGQAFLASLPALEEARRAYDEAAGQKIAETLNEGGTE